MAYRRAEKGAGAPSAPPRFVAYFRVSTARQGSSGLGLDAQREAVGRHVVAARGILVGEFTEVETGTRKRYRPEMAAALATCRLKRAVLVIAKLDRLARNVHFVSGLMESGVEFVACDNPHATRVLIHIMAAFAEYEAEAISRRTKEALAAAKARGVKLGNPNLRPGYRFGLALEGRKARKAQANRRAEDVMHYIEAARRAGCQSLGEIARALMARGIETATGRSHWTAEQVKRVIDRCSRKKLE
jgi:DNA invertase Pin-like site-specific DNA recombinase